MQPGFLPGPFAASPLDDLFGPVKGQEWMASGLCGQIGIPDRFYPSGGDTREVQKICEACPVRTECLQWALDNDERFGIWGGVGEKARRRMKRRSA